MFPIFTRVFWLVVQPTSLVALFAALALMLSFRRGRWWGRSMLVAALVILGTMAFTTFGYALITPLENRFVRPAEPVHIDGIVVLGGGMDGEVDTGRKILGTQRIGRPAGRDAEARTQPSGGQDFGRSRACSDRGE